MSEISPRFERKILTLENTLKLIRGNNYQPSRMIIDEKQKVLTKNCTFYDKEGASAIFHYEIALNKNVFGEEMRIPPIRSKRLEYLAIVLENPSPSSLAFISAFQEKKIIDKLTINDFDTSLKDGNVKIEVKSSIILTNSEVIGYMENELLMLVELSAENLKFETYSDKGTINGTLGKFTPEE